MEITRIEKTGRRYRVYLNDEPCFCIPAYRMSDFQLAEGKELDDNIYERICEEVLIPGARLRCLDLLKARDRTEKELRTRLHRDEYPDEIIDDAIDYAKSYHYIDDRRYAQRFAEMHADKLGSRAIRAELIKKGIDGALADEAVETSCCKDESADAIRNWLIKRRFDPETADDKERTKQIRFLCGKGFEIGEVLKAISDFIPNDR